MIYDLPVLPGFHRAVLLFFFRQVAVKMQATPATKRTSALDTVFDREICLIPVDELVRVVCIFVR